MLEVDVSDIADKWGITQIESFSSKGPMHLRYDVCYARDVRKIEQQNLKLLDELMKSTIALEEKFFITQLEESMEAFFPIFPRSTQKPEKGSCADLIEKACYRNIELIQEIDPQHRTYEELKELYNG